MTLLQNTIRYRIKNLRLSIVSAILIMTRNDYEGETPEEHDASLFIVLSKGDAR